MKKSELKLSQLPDKYEADRKFCGARSDDDFSVALYTWTDEDEKKSNFDCYDNEVIEIASVALVDDCLKMHWCKVETEIITDILKDIDDDMNCLFEFTIWHDGSRQETYLLKQVAYNDDWIYFEPCDCECC